MDDSFLVSDFERLADVLGNIESFLNRNRSACDAVGQRFALDKFEHEIS